MNKTRLLLLLFVLVSGVSIGLFIWLDRETPLKTIHILSNAFKENDWYTFKQYVDIDSFYDSASEKIRASVGKGKFASKLKIIVESTTNTDSPFANLMHSISKRPSSISIQYFGKLTKIKTTISTDYLDITVPAILTISHNGDRYVLSAIDFNEFDKAVTIEGLLLTDHYHLAVDKKINEALSIRVLKKYKGCAQYVGETCIKDLIMVETEISNHSDKAVSEAKYYIYPARQYKGNSEFTRHGSVKNLGQGEYRIVGKEHGWKYDYFVESDVEFMQATKEMIVYEIYEVTFADGAKLKKDLFPYMYVEKNDLPTISDILTRRKQFGKTHNHGYESLKLISDSNNNN